MAMKMHIADSQNLDIMQEHTTRGQSHTKTKSAERTSIPKLTNTDRLGMFGGDSELLTYYLGLREAAERARQTGNPCFCDPRDAKMGAKLNLEGWQPAVTLKDLKDGGDDTQLGLTSKQTALDGETAEMDSDCDSDDEKGDKEHSDHAIERENEAKSFVCGVQGCNAHFTSLASHESHYHTSHNFVCHICRRTFVSNFLLDIHLEENHDSYFQVLSPRLDMYRCLVESCILKFRTADLRKDHLVTVHKFPARFSFHGPVIDKLQKTKSSKKKSRGESKSKNNNSNNIMETTEPTQQETSSSSLSSSLTSTHPNPSTMDLIPHPPSSSSAEMEVDPGKENLESSRGASGCVRGKGQQRNRGRGLAHRSRGRGGRVPATICFGRGSQRAFQQRSGRGRHWHQTQGMDVDTSVDIEKVDFTDMVESLDG